MKERALTFREQVMGIALLLVVFSFLSGLLLLRPLYSSWQEKQRLCQAQQHLLLEKLKVIQQKSSLEQRYEEITRHLKAKGSDEQEMSLFQDEVGAVAKQTGVKVNKTKTRPIEVQPYYKRCLLELDCEGSLLQLSDFIYRMQTSPQALRVQEWRLSLENPRDATLRATLLIRKILIIE